MDTYIIVILFFSLKFIDYVGTLRYMALEILEWSPYDEKVDIWAIGIICYELLTGLLPFHDPYDEYRIEKLILNVDFNIPDQVPHLAKSLIKNVRR